MRRTRRQYGEHAPGPAAISGGRFLVVAGVECEVDARAGSKDPPSSDYVCQACGQEGARSMRTTSSPVWLDRDRARTSAISSRSVPAATRQSTSPCDPSSTSSSRFATRLGFATDIGDVPTRRGWKLTAHAVRVVSVAYVGPATDLRPLRRRALAQLRSQRHGRPQLVQRILHEVCEGDERLLRAGGRRRPVAGRQARCLPFEPVDAELAEQTREELQAVYSRRSRRTSSSSSWASRVSSLAP